MGIRIEETDQTKHDLWPYFVWTASCQEIEKSHDFSSKEMDLVKNLKIGITGDSSYWKRSNRKNPERWPDLFNIAGALYFDIRVLKPGSDAETYPDPSLYARIALAELVDGWVVKQDLAFQNTTLRNVVAPFILELVKEHGIRAGYAFLMSEHQDQLKLRLAGFDASRPMFNHFTSSTYFAETATSTGTKLWSNAELDLTFLAGLQSANVRDQIHGLLNSWLLESKDSLNPWDDLVSSAGLEGFYSHIKRQIRPFRLAGLRYPPRDDNPFVPRSGIGELLPGWTKYDEHLQDGFVMIPSDSDITKAKSLSVEELGLIDELKWRMTHNRYSQEEVPLPISSHLQDPINSLKDLKRGYEGTGPEARTPLHWTRYPYPFLYPRIALFELVEEWRSEQSQPSTLLQLVEDEFVPLVSKLLEKYRHATWYALQSPRIRDKVLRGMGKDPSSSSIERFLQANRDNQGIGEDSAWLYCLALMSDSLRNKAHEILNNWWEKESLEQHTCIVCHREFNLREIYRSGLEKYVINVYEQYYGLICFRCPVVKYPRTQSELSEAVAHYLDVCGFIPTHVGVSSSSNANPIQPCDSLIVDRLNKASYPEFLRSWGAMGGNLNVLEATDSTSWIQALLTLKVLPGEVFLTARGYRCVAKDGAQCRSLDEKQIDDLLLTLGRKHEHEPRYPYDAELNPHERKRADWKVGKVYIEYFGMMSDEEYEEKATQKRRLAQKVGMPFLAIYPEDMRYMTAEKLSIMLKEVTAST